MASLITKMKFGFWHSCYQHNITIHTCLQNYCVRFWGIHVGHVHTLYLQEIVSARNTLVHKVSQGLYTPHFQVASKRFSKLSAINTYWSVSGSAQGREMNSIHFQVSVKLVRCYFPFCVQPFLLCYSYVACPFNWYITLQVQYSCRYNHIFTTTSLYEGIWELLGENRAMWLIR